MTFSDTLPPDQNLEYYSQSPVFTQETLPDKLKAAHAIKAGTYGLLRVINGALRFTLEQEPFTETVLTAGKQMVIEPETLHHVKFEQAGSFQIDFYRSKYHVKRPGETEDPHF